MMLHILAKVLIHVWSYDFYDMTLSTGKQRRHMINGFMKTKQSLISCHQKQTPMQPTEAVSQYQLGQMSRIMRKPTMWFPTRSDTNQAVQPQ